MKIELFSKMVHEKALFEPKRKLEELNKKYAQILDAMEVDCENMRVHYLEGVYRKNYERQRKVISKTHSDVQNRILKKRNELFETLKEELKNEIRAKMDSPKYAAFIKSKIEKTIQGFNVTDELVIVANAKDASFIKGDLTVQIDDRILGGFFILKNGSEKYDLTLDSEVDRLDAYLGCMLNTLYEITGEGCEDEG